MTLLSAKPGIAQEPKRSTGSIQISFLPPPLEKATYSLGIYDAKTNKLVRRLQESALEKNFTVGLNGLITAWDGKDDGGKPVPPGRYAARGYAVGPLKIEGEDIQGNDWTADDEKLRIQRVRAIALVPDDEGLAILAFHGLYDVVARYGGPKTELVWQKTGHEPFLKLGVDLPGFALVVTKQAVMAEAGGTTRAYNLADGHPSEATVDQGGGNPAAELSAGKDGTSWKIEAGVLSQYSPGGERLRSLTFQEGDPIPVAVAASKTSDRLYLLEEKPGWQRVRGLSWVETKEENGHPVSTWQTFFERNIHAPGGASDPDHPTVAANGPVEINLDENPLVPGKAQKLALAATFDAKGSYLATKDGLRLRQVSERPNLEKAYLAKGKPPSPLDFFQYDGAATDQFSVKGIHKIMEFDAGEIELTANGEKTADPKPSEPPDL